jgi:NAD-dependent SIR2 family protein deacetylase
VGSSLEVYSAYRLAARAVARGVSVCIINKGETRAERSGLPIALKIGLDCDSIMKAVMTKLEPSYSRTYSLKGDPDWNKHYRDL